MPLMRLGIHASMSSGGQIRSAGLSGMQPTGEQYDQTFMELMRTVIHHVADEETMPLPNAEAVLGNDLGQLGRRMMKRRMQLTAPRAGEMARDTARARPNTLLFGAGAVRGAAYLYLLRRAFR